MSDNEIQTLKTDVAILKTDVSQLKTDVAILKTDVSEIKSDMVEIKTDIKQLINNMSSNHLYIVDTYVKKSEFEEHKKEEIIGRRWLATYILGAMGLVLGILKIVFPGMV